MDKLDLFKELERVASGNDLDADEIRLYLLLLANCRGSRKGQIEYASIKNAIGGGFSPKKLKKVCQRLFTNNLIAIVSGIPDNMADNTFILSYLILQNGES